MVDMNQKILKIRLMGVVRDKWESKFLEIPEMGTNTKFIEILQYLSKEIGEIFWEFFDKDYSPKRGIIIMIDEVDYKVKGGSDAVISTRSQITILSAIHGG